ncbi:response regulator transcription factor [Paenibacillus hamazuiensis]|uniref:response regulator transcription factor n=1 Tax=Paenibacillus hamazuiensis TaxID=2936508 RepID=UPI00200DD76E|nr:helix-turn-helix domain-containing protein [Paenibacillus hamazuiensis]
MRIMIVDDEVIIRTGLAKVIKWNELGLELLEPAASAEEALRRIPEERPNILLTDIRMTGKTGLQLAEEAKQILPDLEVIILSGYDDFTYTQKAIRQGVSDYLLKTSRPEEIIKTVLLAKQRIEEKWALSSQDLFKNKEARNRLFERLVIEGDASVPGTGNATAYLPKLFSGERGGEDAFLVMLVAAEGWNDSPASEALLLFAVENMLGDLFCCESLIQRQRVVMAVRATDWSTDDMRRQFAFQKIERLLKCELFVAAGLRVDRPDKLHESYEAADEAFGYKALSGDKLCFYEDIAKRKGGKTVCTYEEELELSSIMLDDDPVALKGWTMEFMRQLLADPEVTRKSLEAAVQSVVIAAHRWLERVLESTGHADKIEETAGELRGRLAEFSKEALFQYLYSVMKLYHQKLGEGPAAHVQKAMAYIEENLENDVSLPQVAKHVHLHPNHLSEIFKKETGMTFVDFVARQKIRRAMQILAVSPAKISEVAAKVGYEDVKYFGQIFKKYTGKTPSEYREDAALSDGANKG